MNHASAPEATPIINKATCRAYPSTGPAISSKPDDQVNPLIACARRLERDRAALIAALDLMLDMPAGPGTLGQRHAIRAAARATLARVRS